LRDELQDDGDEQIIFVVLVEQLGKNLDESHKSCRGSKLGHKPKWKEVERLVMFEFFIITLQYNLFTMTNFSDVLFECIDNCFSKLWK
jgi:hypothetical protein